MVYVPKLRFFVDLNVMILTATGGSGSNIGEDD
jgi:hypothetical protein